MNGLHKSDRPEQTLFKPPSGKGATNRRRQRSEVVVKKGYLHRKREGKYWKAKKEVRFFLGVEAEGNAACQPL
jgi:hypothetical protein